jgi:hypothetical protein
MDGPKYPRNVSFILKDLLGSFGTEGGLKDRCAGTLRSAWLIEAALDGKNSMNPATRIKHGPKAGDGKWRVFSQ